MPGIGAEQRMAGTGGEPTVEVRLDAPGRGILRSLGGCKVL